MHFINNYKGLVLGIFAIIVWSLSPTMAGLLEYNTNYFTIVFFMILFSFLTIGVIIFAPILSFIKVSKEEFIQEFNEIDRLGKIYLCCSGIFIAFYYLCFYYSLHNGPRIEMNIINYLWPIITMILSVYVFKNKSEKLSFYQWLLVVVSFIGSVYIAFDNSILFFGNGLDFTYLISFGAAISAGLYLNFNMKLNKYFTSSLYIYFVALIASLVTLLLFYLLVKPKLIINSETIIGILFISIIIFVGGQITWAEALRHSNSIIVASLSYFTPILSASFLNFFLGDKLSTRLVFGATMIIVSNFLLNLKNKNFKATSAAFSFFTIGGLYIFMTIGNINSIRLGEIGFLMQLFGILVAFIYSRIHDMKRKSNEYLININNYLINIYNSIDNDNRKLILSEFIDELFISILDLEYNTNSNLYKNYTINVLTNVEELSRNVSEITRDNNIYDNICSLKKDIRKFIIYSNYSISYSERIVIWLLGIMSIASFFLTREMSFISDIFTLGFSMAIIFLLVQINDISKNNLDYNISDLILRQNILLHLDKDFYIPKFLIDNNNIPWQIGQTEVVKLRYKDSEDKIKTVSINSNSYIQNKLAYIFLCLTILTIAGLIYSKYTNINTIIKVFN